MLSKTMLSFDRLHRGVALVAVAPMVLLGGVVSVAAEMRFRHHFVDRELAGSSWGQTAVADLDRDGRVDFITGRSRGEILWYRMETPDRWMRYCLGENSPSDVGGAVLDVDGDGWTDFITGGAWYRNTGKPRSEPFERIVFDNELTAVHDVAVADVDGDGRPDVLTMSDKNNLRWYRIAADPRQPWQRHDIGPSVHAGIGVGDLDGDGDLDVVRSNQWFENADGKGTRWIVHKNIPFGNPKQPFPLATYCVVVDMDRDGDNDLVMTENEIKGGRIAWLENVDGKGGVWKLHELRPADAAVRGAYHSLIVADFDNDGDLDVFTCEMEGIPGDRPPRWFLWENVDGKGQQFTEHVILDANLGGHAAVAADFDGDGDLDIVAKLWRPRKDNANGGKNHVDFLENLLVTAFAAAPLRLPELKPQADQKYLGAVQTFADNVLRYGKDVYGPKHTPLFVDGLDVDTREPVTWKNDGHRWILCDLANQQNLFRTLDGLSTLSGRAEYRAAAVDALRYAFAHLRSPNGLLHWGGHTAYDAATDEIVGEGYKHEFKCHYPYYELMWQVDPQATRQFIEAFWNSHVLNWSNLDMNRHGDYKRRYASPWAHEYRGGPVFFAGEGLTFINAGSDLYYAGAMLYHFTGNKEPLVWAKRLAERYVETRNPKTGLGGYQYSRYRPGDRAQKQFGPEFGDRILEGTLLEPSHAETKFALAATCQLTIGEKLGDAGREFLQWGLEDLQAYGRTAYDPQTNIFTAIVTDGTRLGPEDVKRDGYYGPKGSPQFSPRPAGPRYFRAYTLAARLSSDPFCWQMARSIARGLRLGDLGAASGEPPWLDLQTSASAPEILIGLLDLYRQTGRREYLQQAMRIGDNILAQRFQQGFFRDGPEYRYASFNRQEPLALLHLVAAMRGKPDAVPAYWMGLGFFHCPYDGLGRTYDTTAIYQQRKVSEQ